MNPPPPPPDVIRCGLCGGNSPGAGYDRALEAPIGQCCHEDMIFASFALDHCGFKFVTRNPAHEK